MKRYIKFLFVISVVLVLSSCVGKTKNTSTSGLTSLVCDDSFENIMNQEIGVFEYIYPNASVIPYYTNERDAVDSLIELKTKTIVIPRELTKQEKDYLKSKDRNARSCKIAVDAIALIVNPENPVEILSLNEIAEILSGSLPSRLGVLSTVPASLTASRKRSRISLPIS